jgi:hypothetical protein
MTETLYAHMNKKKKNSDLVVERGWDWYKPASR